MDGLDFSALSEDQLLVLVRAALREIASRDEALIMAAETAMIDERERHDIAVDAVRAEATRLRESERSHIVALARDLARAGLERQMPAVEAARAHAATQAAAAHAAAAMLDERERATVAAAAAEHEAGVQRARERERIAAEVSARMRAEAEIAGQPALKQRAEQAAAAAAARAAAIAARGAAILREIASLIGHDPAAITIVLVSTRFGRRLIVNRGGCNQFSRDHLADIGVSEGVRTATVRELIPHKPALAAIAARLAVHYPAGTLVLAGADIIHATKAAQ